MEHNPNLPWYRRLHWQVLVAMVVGAITGLVVGEPAAESFGWIGDLFMKLLRMIIVPLVLTSIISGVASVGRPLAEEDAGRCDDGGAPVSMSVEHVGI